MFEDFKHCKMKKYPPDSTEAFQTTYLFTFGAQVCKAWPYLGSFLRNQNSERSAQITAEFFFTNFHNGENLRRKKSFFNSLFGIISFLNRCVFKKSRSEFIMGRCSMASVRLNDKSDTYIILALVSLAEFV